MKKLLVKHNLRASEQIIKVDPDQFVKLINDDHDLTSNVTFFTPFLSSQR